ncbi:enoyl-CoA hydratase/isomerase family protein [Chloroflexota bacterium]
MKTNIFKDTGKKIDDKEAKQMGLVNQVVAAGKLENITHEIAGNIAKLPLLSIQLCKRALYQGLDNSLITQAQYEAFALNYLRSKGDHEEVIRTFLVEREGNKNKVFKNEF